jgi:hypothetical protein
VDKRTQECWRVAELVLLLVAIMGPWAFDRIYVPSEYSCSAPYFRLDDDFCGTPLRGITVFSWMAGAFINICVELVTGAIVLTDRAGEFLFSLFLFLLLLPFFSTLLLILRGDRRRWQVFNAAAWGLTAGIGLLIGSMSSYPKLFWVLWGIWLYIGLAASALILEVLTLAAGRRPSQG